MADETSTAKPTKKYFTRVESAQYLTDRGVRTSPKTLAKQAVTGGGPDYGIYGNRVLSTAEQLDAHIERKLKPRKSTSDA
jgi:hypothetical protein